MQAPEEAAELKHVNCAKRARAKAAKAEAVANGSSYSSKRFSNPMIG
jgi:hypothetical protein